MTTQTEASDYLRTALEAASVVRGISAATPRRAIAAIGVIGAGTMGSGIAMVFANAGLPVTLVEQDADGLGRGLSRVDEVYQRARAKGALPEAELTARRARITGYTDLAKLGNADLIVEAVFEDMAVKTLVFRATR
jgi:3-hydroxyacyl-CoA dehydrogenase